MAPKKSNLKSNTTGKSKAPPKPSKKMVPKGNTKKVESKNVARGRKRQAPEESEDPSSDEEPVTKASSHKKAKHAVEPESNENMDDGEGEGEGEDVDKNEAVEEESDREVCTKFTQMIT